MSVPAVPDLLDIFYAAPDAGGRVLMQRAMQQIVRAVPDITLARAFLGNETTLWLWGTSMSDDPMAERAHTSDDLPHHIQALTQPEAFMVLPDSNTLLVAMRRIAADQAESIGVLALHYADAIPEDKQVAPALARQITLVMHNRHMETVLRQQVQVLASLNESRNFEEMAGVLGSYTLNPGQFVSINLFDRPEQDALPTGIRIIVTANQEDVYTPDDYLAVDADFARSFLTYLDSEEGFLAESVANDGRLPQRIKDWLSEQKIVSIFQLPLRIGDNVYGFISYNDMRSPIVTSQVEKQAFHSIADQVAVNLERQDLLEQTRRSLEETRTLYQVSDALMHANTMPELLTVLQHHVASDAKSISLVTMSYQYDVLVGITIRYLIRDGAVVEVNQPIHTSMSGDDLVAIQTYWQGIGDNLEVTADVSQTLSDVTPFQAYLKQQGVGSAITIPVLEDGVRTYQISIAWAEPRTFEKRYLRLMEAVQAEVTIVLQNQAYIRTVHQTAEESARQLRVLQLLNDLSIRSNSPDLDETQLLDMVAEVLVKATGTDYSAILMVDPDRAYSTVTSEYPASGLEGKRFRNDDGINARLLTQEAALQVHNIADDPNLNDDNRAILLEAGMKAGIYLPLLDAENRLPGIAAAFYQEPVSEFDPEMLEVAQTIVSQAVVNLQKIRLIEESRRQTTQLRRITAFSQAIQTDLQSQTILETAMSFSQQILSFDYLTIITYNLTSGDLNIVARYEGDTNQIDMTGIAVDVAQNHPVEEVWQQKVTRQYDDLREYPDVQHPYRAHLRTLIVTPIMTRGIASGLLEIGSRLPGAYNDADIAAIQQITGQIGVALANADAFARSQKVARNKALANDIIARMQEQIEVEKILDVTAAELGRALGAKKARIRLGIDLPDKP